MINNDIALRVENLSMKFGGLLALNNISFDIKKGSIYSMIGPNGAGKTTVFNCCTGFYTPSSGKIFMHTNAGVNEITSILGREKFSVFNLGGKFKNFYNRMFSGSFKIARLGMVRTFQNVRVFKGLSVIENLLVAQHHKLNWNLISGVVATKSYKQALNNCIDTSYLWLDRLGLNDDIHSLAGSLPYGKTRKLELARAMCTDPEIICLDEPAAGLNNFETEELGKVIIKLRDDHKVTVFLIEHDMSMVMKISDVILVLDHGEKIAEGTPNSIKNNPKVIEAYLGTEEN